MGRFIGLVYLFDMGATHSFMASAFVSSLGLSFETLCGGLVVASPMGGVMVASEVCRSCVVRIAGQELTADLVVLDMVGHDIILGLDWWVDIMHLWTAIRSGLVYRW